MNQTITAMFFATTEEQKTWSLLTQLLMDSYAESKIPVLPFMHVEADRPYYFCQTGLSKQLYTYRLGVDGKAYSDVFEFTIYPSLQRLLQEQAFCGCCFMIVDDSKELALIFQPSAGCTLSPLTFAETIDRHVQSMYQEHFPHGTGRYCNTTALSEPIVGVVGAREGYLQTEALKAASFFRMTPGVITTERLSSIKNHAAYRDVISLARQLCQSAAQGEDAKMLALAEKLFLDLLKHSYDMELVRDALSYIKQFLSIRLSVHLPKETTDLTALCSASSYVIIEECYEAILPVMTRLCHAVQQTGAWSDAVAYAAYYLHSNLGQDVSLPEIAAFADATPTYLSNLFHQQTGMTIKQYQQMIRMEHACFLLETTQKRIADIASESGFYDRRYFTRIFKETCGMTPQEYRLSHS